MEGNEIAKAHRVFKRCLEVACSTVEAVKFGELMRSRGVNDFLLEADQEEWSVRELAARALSVLCECPPRLHDGIICSAVVGFLDETFDPPPQDPAKGRRLKDLKELVEKRASLRAYQEWVDAWYS